MCEKLIFKCEKLAFMCEKFTFISGANIFSLTVLVIFLLFVVVLFLPRITTFSSRKVLLQFLVQVCYYLGFFLSYFCCYTTQGSTVVADSLHC